MPTQGRQTLLLLDTCGECSSVAVFDGPRCAAEVFLPERAASASLLKAIGDALRLAETELGYLAGVGIATGPGSFTGIRIGLAVAKGLCEAVGCPLVGVPRLAVLMEAGGGEVEIGALFAGRKEVYLRKLDATETATESLVEVGELGTVVADRSVAYAEPSLAAFLITAGSATLVELGARHLYPLVTPRLNADRDDLAVLDANYVREEGAIYPKMSRVLSL